MRPIPFRAADGYPLKGFEWRHSAADSATGSRPVVVINPATSVRCRYYSRFADFLHRHGFDVVAYDYRGIGESRPASLRRLNAGWLDWGRLDFEAALCHARDGFAGQPIHVVAHSVGGLLVGLAPSNRHIERVFTMGAQFAHWEDYAPDRRFRMLLKWHVLMPALTTLLGYFPGQRLGWLEDTPRGVVRDWTARAPRFEDSFLRGPHALSAQERQALVSGFAALRAPTLALGFTDDEWGTLPALRRLLRHFTSSPSTLLHVRPPEIGLDEVGHFAFFHSRFEQTLWPLALEWLRTGVVREEFRRFAVPVGEA